MSSSCAFPEIAYSKKHVTSGKKSWRTPHRHIPIRISEGWFSMEPPVYALIDADEETRLLFQALESEWKAETWHISSVKRTISHPAYLKIIGLGKDALPLIFEDLRREQVLWFWALEAITRAEILPNTTSMNALREAWLEWADEHGY